MLGGVILFNSKYDFRFFKAILIYFVMTLIVLTIDMKIAGNNTYIYMGILSIWFIGILAYEIKGHHNFLSEQWHQFKLNKFKNIGIIILFYIILQVVVSLAGSYFNNFAPAKSPYPSYSFPIDTWTGLTLSLLVGFVNLGVAFVEEIAYRHEMMYRFKNNKLLMLVSIIISSLLFGFSHYYNFSGSLIASLSYAIAGIVLSFAYITSKNIWIPIFTHILFNFISVFSVIVLIIFKIIA